MSRQAPSSLFADLCASLSPVTGCKQGSVPTPWHISVKNSAVISLISLCRIEGKPPQEQLKACSIVNFWSHTQREGSWSGCQPYLRHKASRKAPLWRVNPWSAIGRVLSHVEAPFSDDTSIALCKFGGNLLAISFASVFSLCLRLVREWFSRQSEHFESPEDRSLTDVWWGWLVGLWLNGSCCNGWCFCVRDQWFLDPFQWRLLQISSWNSDLSRVSNNAWIPTLWVSQGING